MFLMGEDLKSIFFILPSNRQSSMRRAWKDSVSLPRRPSNRVFSRDAVVMCTF